MAMFKRHTAIAGGTDRAGAHWILVPFALVRLITAFLTRFYLAVTKYRVGAALGLGAVLLISCAVGTNMIVLGNLREDALQSAEADLARHTLLLAEQTEESFQSLDLILSSCRRLSWRKESTTANRTI